MMLKIVFMIAKSFRLVIMISYSVVSFLLSDRVLLLLTFGHCSCKIKFIFNNCYAHNGNIIWWIICCYFINDTYYQLQFICSWREYIKLFRCACDIASLIQNSNFPKMVHPRRIWHKHKYILHKILNFLTLYNTTTMTT